MSIFSFGTNLGLASGKYFLRIIFDNKIEISILEILHCQISNNLSIFNFRSILDLTGSKYFIKIIFDIIWAINNWLFPDELLYLDKLFQNQSFIELETRKFHYFYFFELLTRKFYFNLLLFRVSSSKILICLFSLS